MTSLEKDIDTALFQPQFGGMGSMEIHFNPYLAKWICSFNWSNNIPISRDGSGFEDAIYKTINAINSCIIKEKQ